MRAQHVLVTGASGFLGRHVLDAAGDRTATALVRDRDAWPYDDDTPLVCGELTGTDWHSDPRLHTVDTVLHLAGHVHHSREHSKVAYDVNVDGTLGMVRFAASVGARMVLISTSGVVGCFRDPDQTADEHAPYATDVISRWPYYRSKMLAEQSAKALCDELGVTLVILRPPMLYGPGDHRFRTTNMAVKIMKQRFPARIPGGVAFTDIRDVADAVWAAAELASPRPVYHLPGETWSVKDFFGAIAELGGVKPPRFELPYRLAHTLALAARPLSRLTGKNLMPDPVVVEMGAHHWGMSSQYADELGFSPRPASETLSDTVMWLREHHPDMRELTDSRAP